jgi:Na+/proline symporter
MGVAQAAFLIPIGIILYTVAGGLKATFISSYVHTVIIYVVLCIFSFYVYTPSSVSGHIGSPGKARSSPPSVILPCMYMCHAMDVNTCV